MAADSVRQLPAEADRAEADRAEADRAEAGLAEAGLDSAWPDWHARRPPPDGIHFDTAAAGRSSRATLAATAAHAEREAVAGAYVAQAEAAPVLEQGRADLARLLGLPAAGLAFTESASAARAALLAAWPLRPGDTVAIVRSEWGPNMTAFVERAGAGRPAARDSAPDTGGLTPRPGPARRRGRGAVPGGRRAPVGGCRPGPRPRGHRGRG